GGKLPSLKADGRPIHVRVSADFRHVLRAQANGDVVVHAIEGDVPLRTIKGEGRQTWLCQGSGDGRLQCCYHDLPSSGRAERVVRILDLAAGEEIARYAGVTDLCLSTDGRRLGLLFLDRQFAIVDVPTRAEIARFTVKSFGAPTAVAGDGSLAAIERESRFIDFYDPMSGAKLRELQCPAKVMSIAISPDARLVAAGAADYRAYVWSAAGALRTIVQGHDAEISGVQFSQGGDILVTRGWDDRSILWDAWTGARLLQLSGGVSHFAADDRRIGWAARQEVGWHEFTNPVEVRSLAGRHDLPTGPMVSKQPKEAAFSADGRILATVGTDGVRFADSADGRALGHLPALGATWIGFAPAGDAFFAAGARGAIKWPIRRVDGDGSLVIGPPHRLPGGGIHLSTACLSRDGRRIAVLGFPRAGYSGGGQVASIRILALPGGETVQTIVAPGAVKYPALSPDGRFLAAGNDRGADACAWDVASGKLLRRFSIPHSCLPVFTPQGDRLLLRSERKLEVIDVRDWETERVYECEHSGAAQDFAVDGSILLHTTTDRKRVLRDLTTGRPIAEFDMPIDSPRATAYAFSLAGLKLAAVHGEHQVVRLWDLGRILRQVGELNLRPALPEFAVAPWAQSAAPPALMLRLESGDPDFWLESDPKNAVETVRRMRRRLALDPEDAEASHMLGHALYELREDSGALEAFTAALKLDPADSHLYASRSVVHARAGREAEAAADRARSIELDPDQPGLADRHAWRLLSGPAGSRDPKRALELARRNVEMEPQRAVFQWTLGVAELRAGEPLNAVAAFGAAARLDPRIGRGASAYYVASARARAGDKNGAETAFKEAQQWTSTRPQAKETLRAETVEAAAEARAALAAAK
ncbi:MAG TPA: hypothetical protein VNC50_07700, partial [Planctomycetia bacterium]|nr:hypothetical protein [Planctomycetia bacterium]